MVSSRENGWFYGESRFWLFFIHTYPLSYPQHVDNFVDANCKINPVLIFYRIYTESFIKKSFASFLQKRRGYPSFPFQNRKNNRLQDLRGMV